MEEVIRKYFQCWLDKDIDAVKEIFSDDIIYSECYGPVYKGIGQIIRWFEDWNQKGTVLQWDIKRVVVSGNTAVVEWFFSVTTRAMWMVLMGLLLRSLMQI